MLTQSEMPVNEKNNSAQVGRLAGSVLSPSFISIVIAAITFMTFAQVLRNDFVLWDDDWVIYENPTLGGLSLENLRLIFANVTVSSSWYTPLAGLRWCITYQFFGLDPYGYHLGNLLFHAGSAVLIFFLLRRLLILGFLGTDKAGGRQRQITVSAALGVLVWSLHPLRVAPVAGAAAGAYSQAVFFLVLSLVCYLRANDAAVAAAVRRLCLAAAVVLFAASLLSQPIGMCAVVIFIVVDVYPLRRLGGNRGWWKSNAARRVLLEKLLFVAVSLVVALITVCMHLGGMGGHGPVTLSKFGLIDRIMQAMYVWAYYAWRPWYPVNLAPTYATLWSFVPLSLPFVVSGLAVVGTTVALLLLRRRWPLGLALAICHLVLLLPNLGLLEHPHYHVDRYSIIVSICWSVLLSAWLASPKTGKLLRSGRFMVSVAALVALGMLSIRQTRVWNNSIIFFEHTIRTVGDQPYTADMYWRLGDALKKQGRTSDAFKQFERAVEIDPNHPTAHCLFATALAQRGRIDDAMMHYRRAIQLDPNNASAHGSMALLLLWRGEAKEAISHWREVLRLRDDWPQVRNDLARILATHKDGRLRNGPEAVRLAERACQMTNYKAVGFLDTLAAAYAETGQFDRAVKTAESAVQLAWDAGKAKLVEDICSRLELYKAKRPYHQSFGPGNIGDLKPTTE